MADSSGTDEASVVDEAVAQTTFFAAAAAAHEADTADPVWSRRGEDDIGALVKARAAAFALERADCRSHTCVAQLHARAREGSSGALEDLVASLNAVFSDVSVDRQPSGALKIYLAR